MKSLLIIPLYTTVALVLVAIVLAGVGVRVHPADPLCAAAIAAIAGVIGVAPVVLRRPNDQAEAVPLALAGTVLHLLSAAVMGVSLLASKWIGDHSRTGYWLLGSYGISLVVTIGQLRRSILAAPIAKAEK
ncbi:MAG TPA: hypothetical protein VHY37_01330 [Tepidisphaeraceae bacterium]|jgi:ABC-type cobalamin transport system permease subunit|nr:hypothetical protein [Tepidisphaeraceae bacterium]